MQFEPCKVCSHAAREQIERGAKDAKSFAFIAERYEVTDEELKRHMDNHMRALTTRNVEAEVVPLGANPQALFVACNDVIKESHELIAHCKENDNAKGWAAGIGEWRRCIETQARMMGMYNGVDPAIRMAQFARYRQTILEALRPFPEAFQAVLDALKNMESGDGGQLSA